jgi:penicillin-binding protein 1B
MAGTKKRAGARKKRRRKGRPRGRPLRVVLAVATVVGVGCALVLLYLYVEVTRRFESRLWTAPSTVYSAPLTVPRGASVSIGDLARRLDRCGYARVADRPARPGQYRVGAGSLEVRLRPLSAPGFDLPARWRLVRTRAGRIDAIEDRAGHLLPEVSLEPEVLATLHGTRQEEREVLPYEAFPERFVAAVLAAEDARFFSHRGVDPRAMARATVVNLRRGGIVQGASTVPQQTVKNLYLGHERTWWRKLREIPMALMLDSRYPKERILEVYLNEVYLGQRGPVAVCGAQSAARFYFGRSLYDLSLAEWALLAGMIRSPGRYNPFVHPDRALARRDQVLDAMLRLEWAQESEVERARAERLSLASGESGFGRAGYLVDYVRADLRRRYPARVLQEEGLHVHTTLDTRLQEAAAEALEAGLARLEASAPQVRRQLDRRRLEGAVVVTEPGSGAIRAMVGGRDYRRTQYNRAVQARRQPGSCFKPFVYLAGFEHAKDRKGGGLTPATLLDDSPMERVSGGQTWRPGNHDGRFRGEVPVRRVLEESINVPTVRAAERVGLDQIIETAERCGIAGDLVPLPSLALGAQEVSPLDLARAYGTLATGGIRVEPRIIREIRGPDGQPIEQRGVERARAVRATSAFLVNNILQGVLDRGTARSARSLGYRGRAAGKTGTTDETRDAWFVGYTPEILALVWVGYDDNARTGLGGSTGALPVWVDVMAAAESTVGAGDFEVPGGMVRERIDPTTGMLAAKRCPETVDEWFVRDALPPGPCREHGGGFRSWVKRVFGRRH